MRESSYWEVEEKKVCRLCGSERESESTYGEIVRLLISFVNNK